MRTILILAALGSLIISSVAASASAQTRSSSVQSRFILKQAGKSDRLIDGTNWPKGVKCDPKPDFYPLTGGPITYCRFPPPAGALSDDSSSQPQGRPDDDRYRDNRYAGHYDEHPYVAPQPEYASPPAYYAEPPPVAYAAPLLACLLLCDRYYYGGPYYGRAYYGGYRSYGYRGGRGRR